MGYLVGKYYDEQSNIRMAGNLKGKLLLIHGSLDFMIVNAVLRPGYSLAVSKKYFNQAKKELIHAAEQGS